jgi:pimeloyl-ACP methyl ester carboxylesterase
VKLAFDLFGLQPRRVCATVLLDELKIDRIVAVDCAMGSAIAASLAAMRPDRILGRIMANLELKLDDDARARLTQRAHRLERHGPESALPEGVDRIFNGIDDPKRKARYLAFFRQLDGRCAAAYIRGFLTLDITDALGRMRCLTLLAAAANYTLSGHDTTTKIAVLPPGAEHVVFAGASHFGPYQAPQEFAATVAAFLAKIS